MLIFAAVYDAKHMRIPNIVPITIVILGLVSILFMKAIVPHFTGLLCAILICVFVRIISKDGLGFGDIKLLVSLGFALRIELFLRATVVIAITSFAAGCVLLLFKKADKKTRIPFAPFIALGFTVSIILELWR